MRRNGALQGTAIYIALPKDVKGLTALLYGALMGGTGNG
jgi:hypothetical protein